MLLVLLLSLLLPCSLLLLLLSLLHRSHCKVQVQISCRDARSPQSLYPYATPYPPSRPRLVFHNMNNRIACFVLRTGARRSPLPPGFRRRPARSRTPPRTRRRRQNAGARVQGTPVPPRRPGRCPRAARRDGGWRGPAVTTRRPRQRHRARGPPSANVQRLRRGRRLRPARCHLR